MVLPIAVADSGSQYEAEYERMVELKRESMSLFIANARVEIERLWDEIILGEEERGAFAPFGDGKQALDLFSLAS